MTNVVLVNRITLSVEQLAVFTSVNSFNYSNRTYSLLLITKYSNKVVTFDIVLYVTAIAAQLYTVLCV